MAEWKSRSNGNTADVESRSEKFAVMQLESVCQIRGASPCADGQLEVSPQPVSQAINPSIVNIYQGAPLMQGQKRLTIMNRN